MAKTKAPLNLDPLTEEQLLDLRLCDLPIEIKGSWVEERIQQLYKELESRGLRLKPACYVGDEWFTPDGVAAIALPFYLFHPRLLQLEKKMMLEAEGGNAAECLRLLRHECGHSYVHAFHLTRRRAWVKLFGSPRAELKDFYHFRPTSRSYVRHLKGWYAQSHPEEDFAETFAVWLDPDSDWKKKYAGWPALKKLEYVDTLMAELKSPVRAASRSDMTYQVGTLKRKLSRHYQQRRLFYAEEGEDYYDSDLKTLFPAADGAKAAHWIKTSGPTLDKIVATWTHEPRLTVRRMRVRLKLRCIKLGLRLPKDADSAKLGFAAYLSSLISNYVFTSHFKEAAVKKSLNVLVLFDYHTSTPADGDYAKRLDEQDWLPIKSVIATLKELGHEVKPFAIYDDILPLVEVLKKDPPDLVFNMADSFKNSRRYEADIAGLLELSGVPFTGCPPQALSVCHTKSFAKRILVPLGIELPKALVFPVGVMQRPLNTLRFPVIVKPLSEEGSEGISQNSFAETEEKCLERVRFLHETMGADAFVEEYIAGREIYAGILGNTRLTVLPLREMIFQKFSDDQPKFATFKAKWDEAFREKWGIKNIFAKDLPDSVLREIDQVSRTVYHSLGLRGCGRIDMRVTDKGEVFVLEVNPNPNLAPDDEIAKAAQKAGLSYPQLIHKMLALGLKEAEVREVS